MPIHTACLQFKPERGLVNANRQRLCNLFVEARELGAKLLVAPEMATSGYVFPDRGSILPSCETRDGESVETISALAVRLQATLVFGWPEIVAEEKDRLFNSAAVCFPNGERMYYRKNFLYETDKTWAEPGDNPYPVWTLDGGMKATLGICMDLNDPAFREHLRRESIRVCCFPTNWLDQDFTVWNYWAWCLQGSLTCLLGANTYGEEDHIRFRGESAILDGRVLLATAPSKGDQVIHALVPDEPTPFPDWS